MSKAFRLLKSVLRLLLPVLVSVVVMVMIAAVLLVHSASTPPTNTYLVTPEVYGRLSAHAARITDETWANRDGTKARGWLLRGKKNAPAVVLLHRFGADRSYVLNLGVKLSESTDFTVLMPDLRGHGPKPLVANSSFGGCEIDDTLSAIDFLRSLRDGNRENLVGADVGIYGVELGALAAVATAARDQSVKALVLDSVPRRSDEIVRAEVSRRYPFVSSVTSKMAEGGTFLYYAAGCYERAPVCRTAKQILDRKVLLMSGADAKGLKSATDGLSACFPPQNKVRAYTNLSASGYDIVNVSLEKANSYHEKVIYFFQENLRRTAIEEEADE